jgi:GNAT superfamily N-acetyltransferase
MTLPKDLNGAALAASSTHGAVTVRPLAQEDRADWDRLWGRYLTFYETSLPKAQYDLSWQRLFDPGEPMFGYIAEVDGKACGLVHIVFHRSFWLEGQSCYLQDLYADAAVRGTGVGRALIQHVYDVAHAAGSTRVHWLTQYGNTTARLLYDRIAEESGFLQYRKNV